MSEKQNHPVERLFPFVLRSRILITGRENLARCRGRLNFVLIASDISEPSRQGVLEDFERYPVVQHFSSAELEAHFGARGARVVGFKKSHLAQSIYRELRQYRINRSNSPPRQADPPNAG